MEKKIQGRKKTIIVGIVIAVVIITVAVIAIIAKNANGNKSYRSIKVTEISGDVSISKEDGDSYSVTENMNLVSGDRIVTGADSYVIIKADTDKYMRLAENSAMVLTASGSSQNSKTIIELENGSILNEIQEHLSDDSTYDVKTPGATMSVRGTVYNVTYDIKTKESGLYVYDGVVNCTDIQGASDDYEKGEYNQFAVKDDGSVEYIVQKGQITEDMIPLQIKEWLDEIQSEGRNVTYVKKEAVKDTTAVEAPQQNETATTTTKAAQTIVSTINNQDTSNNSEITNNVPVDDNQENNADNNNNSDKTDSNNSDDIDDSGDDSKDATAGDYYVHVANPLLLSETGTADNPLVCTVSDSACVIGTTTVTAPIEYWGYGKTYAKDAIISTANMNVPKVNLMGTFAETPQFVGWMNIGNTTLAEVEEFIVQKSDTYYPRWTVGQENYFPVEIHFGSKTYVVSVKNGTVLNINDSNYEAIYTNTSITVE